MEKSWTSSEQAMKKAWTSYEQVEYKVLKIHELELGLS